MRGSSLAPLAALRAALLRRQFAKEVLTLQAGSFATMGLQFITSVVVANLLGAQLYGTYFQARSLLDLVAMLANLAVGQALVTRLAAAHSRRDRAESRDILAYFLKVGVAVAVVEFALGLIGAGYLGALVLDDPRLGEMSRVLFVSPILSIVLNMVILALQSSRQIGRLTLLENGVLIGTSLLNVAGVLLAGVDGILYSVAFAPLLASIAAAFIYRATLPKMVCMPSFGEVLRAAPGIPFRRYFGFSALVSVDKNFANLLALAPTLLLGKLAADADVAYFRVGFNLMNFLSVPLAPISRNLYAKLAEVREQRGPRPLGSSLLKVTAVSGLLSVVMTGCMVIAAPYILRIYRSEYVAALPVMYALGLRFALLGFGVGLGPIYQVLDAMKLAIVTKVVPAAFMFGGGWVLVSRYQSVGAAATLVLAYVIGDLTNAVLVPWMLRRAAGGTGNREQGTEKS